jgi:hypothetical protein
MHIAELKKMGGIPLFGEELREFILSVQRDPRDLMPSSTFWRGECFLLLRTDGAQMVIFQFTDPKDPSFTKITEVLQRQGCEEIHPS